MSNINYMLGNLIGRAIVISLFAYILWFVYNNMNNMPQPVFTQESRRFGGSGYARHARSFNRFGRR
jgi:hypothetical protein